MCGTIPENGVKPFRPPPVVALPPGTSRRPHWRRGNSATIFSHYRALATEAEGKAWFAIVPPHSSANVVRPPRATKA